MTATPQIDFDPASHTYRVGGRTYPSVTQILERARVIDYSHLPWSTRNMALARGTAVHLATAYDDEGELDEDTACDVMPYVRGWRKFRREMEFYPSDIEIRGYSSKYRYCGTADRRGHLNGRLVLLDIKTNDAPAWTRLQLAAYAEMLDIRDHVRIAVELHMEGYRIDSYPLATLGRDISDFLCCLRAVQLAEEFAKK